jgi:hypothetical protein
MDCGVLLMWAGYLQSGKMRERDLIDTHATGQDLVWHFSGRISFI